MYNENLSFVERNLQKVERGLKSESIVVLELPVYTDETDRDNVKMFLNALRERNLEYKFLDSKRDGMEKLVVAHLSENVKTNRDIILLTEMIASCLSLTSKFDLPIKTRFEYKCLGDRDKVYSDVSKTLSDLKNGNVFIVLDGLSKMVVEVWK